MKQVITFDNKELDQFEERAYKAARKANQELFGGLLSFFNRLFDENELIIKELDYIKSVIQLQEDKPKNNGGVVKNVDEKVVGEDKSPSFGSLVNQNLFNLSDEEKTAMSEAFKKMRNQSIIPNIPVKSVEFPKLRGDNDDTK
ncbi:hypothetical protein [Bacillus weihaiensis]|uniref:hypothetical protein n=1 Tax=Bacillus weihaiensis TaxID=1547283 RepID=UPI0023527EB2|nr:hypothetical protein [Bacillus weihaiensis]